MPGACEEADVEEARIKWYVVTKTTAYFSHPWFLRTRLFDAVFLLPGRLIISIDKWIQRQWSAEQSLLSLTGTGSLSLAALISLSHSLSRACELYS